MSFYCYLRKYGLSFVTGLLLLIGGVAFAYSLSVGWLAWGVLACLSIVYTLKFVTFCNDFRKYMDGQQAAIKLLRDFPISKGNIITIHLKNGKKLETLCYQGFCTEWRVMYKDQFPYRYIEKYIRPAGYNLMYEWGLNGGGWDAEVSALAIKSIEIAPRCGWRW